MYCNIEVMRSKNFINFMARSNSYNFIMCGIVQYLQYSKVFSLVHNGEMLWKTGTSAA